MPCHKPVGPCRLLSHKPVGACVACEPHIRDSCMEVSECFTYMHQLPSQPWQHNSCQWLTTTCRQDPSLDKYEGTHPLHLDIHQDSDHVRNPASASHTCSSTITASMQHLGQCRSASTATTSRATRAGGRGRKWGAVGITTGHTLQQGTPETLALRQACMQLAMLTCATTNSLDTPAGQTLTNHLQPPWSSPSSSAIFKTCKPSSNLLLHPPTH